MKNALIAISILIVITGASILCIHFTENTSITILDTLDRCEDTVVEGNWDLALDHIYFTNALWNKYRPIFAAYLQHSELNKVSDSLCRATSLVMQKNKDDFLVENGCLSELIDEISRLDKITFENLF